MSVNKNALIRYKILDTCFSNPYKKYFIDDLIFEINKRLLEITPDSKGIQKRQVFEDIKYMESAEGWSAEIKRIQYGKKKYYRYNNPNFSINSQLLNVTELEHLHSAINIITRFKGMPQFEWINEFAPKLEQAFIITPNAPPIISFDSNEYLKGVEFLSDLFHAVLHKRPLSIKYLSYKSTIPKIFILHPYYLKQYNNRWFLFGQNEELQRLTVIALDRIIQVEDFAIPYHENIDYDFNDYFDDIIGVTRPDEGLVEKIILEFNESTLPYVLSKPLHGSQKTVKAEERILISIEVMCNFELESLLLSFGDRVKIMSPQHLQDKINQRLQSAALLYKD